VERGVSAAALHHLGRLLGACLDSLPGLRSDAARFTVLCVANRAVDVSIWRRACCPAADAADDDEEDSDEVDAATTTAAEDDAARRPSVLSTRRLTRRGSQELAAQVNLDRLLSFSAHSRPLTGAGEVPAQSAHAPTSTQRHVRPLSWKNKSPFRHQESQRSIVVSPTAGGGTVAPVPASAASATVEETREPSGTAPADADGPPPAAVPPPDPDDSTPLGVLSSRDPSLLLGVLREAVGRQKATLGAPGRHRCSPSVRSRHCAPHCLQMNAARLLR